MCVGGGGGGGANNSSSMILPISFSFINVHEYANEIILYMTIHRRRKLFNIGGNKPSAANFNILWGGGGWYCQKYIYTYMHIHMYAHTCVKCSYTHACMHTNVWMHAQPMHSYILHPDVKIIKIKASDLYEKTATNIYK